MVVWNDDGTTEGAVPRGFKYMKFCIEVQKQGDWHSYYTVNS